jgi:hypothetical protein
MVAQLDSPIMAGFVDQRETLNTLAENSPGYVWQYSPDENYFAHIRPFYGDDDLILVNLSVWQDVESLHAYTYKTSHGKAMTKRRNWFTKVHDVYLVMWWVAPGHNPTIAESEAKLAYLRSHGPSPSAFTFRQTFNPPQ